MKRHVFPLALLAVVVFFLFFLTPIAFAAELPLGLQKIKEYNRQSTKDFAVKVSFLIAFVAGMLGILSPCILPFLPAYFSYTFKEKQNLTLMTGVFAIGFTIVFVTLGIIAGILGEQSLAILQKRWITSIAGVFLIGMSWFILQGKGLISFVPSIKRFSNDVPGVFLFGVFFALGWTACVGPILAGILGVGAILGNLGQAALLLLFYSLGNLVPLFLLSFCYDRFRWGEWSWIKGRRVMIPLGEKKWEFHSTNMISAGILFLIGIVLLIFGSTAIVNTVDLLGTREYFYSLQRALLEWEPASVAGIAGLVVLAMMIVYSWRKKNTLSKIEDKKTT